MGKDPAEKKERLFTANYLKLIALSLITALSYNMMAALLASYAVGMGASLTLAGTLVGLYSLSALVMRPFAGMASDLWNKKTICMISTALVLFSMIGYTLAPSVPVLFAVRVIHGMSFGISGTANMALGCEFVPQERLAEGMGYFGLGQILAQVAGPASGAWIQEQWGYPALFMTIGVLVIIGMLLLATVKDSKKEPAPQEVKPKITLNSLIAKECIVYSLIAATFSASNGIVSSYLKLSGEAAGIKGVMLFFTVNSAVLFVLRIVIGKAIDRYPLIPVVVLSLLTTALSMGMLAYAGSLAVVLISAVFKALGQGTGQLSLQTACVRRAGPARTGVAISTYYIGADIAQGLSPTIGGAITSRWGYPEMYLATGALALLAVIAFWIYQARIEKRTETKGETKA